VEEGLNPQKLGQVAKLTDYFPEKEVLKALLNHVLIKEALAGESPSSLAKLFKLLEGQRLEIHEVPCVIPQDFLTRFVFHHLQGETVDVRQGLPSVGGPYRGLHAELELLLPFPPALKEPLTLADSGKEGFLVAGQKKVAGEAVTLIPFSFKRKGKVK
jgi:hypothetical protein